MRKLIYLLTSCFAISSFVYIFCPTYLALGVSFGVSLVVLLLGFLIESKIKTTGGLFFNKILYYLSKSDKDYNCEKMSCTYTCLDNKYFECKKDITLKSKRHDLQGVTERYRWSAFASNASIVPINPNHKIKNNHQEEDWSYYFVDFAQIVTKNKKIDTGSIIKNLHDPQHDPVPFFNCTITKKTKLLVLNVEFPQNTKPNGDAVFKTTVNGKEVGKPEVLKYDLSKEGFTKTIQYPRKGWRYIISWDV